LGRFCEKGLGLQLPISYIVRPTYRPNGEASTYRPNSKANTYRPNHEASPGLLATS